METLTPIEAVLKVSMSAPQPIDVKFWVFSKRMRVKSPDHDSPSRIRIYQPRAVFGISSILKQTDYFNNLLSAGFGESGRATRFYAPFPAKEQDYVDDYDYESDSDLDGESDTGEDEDEDSPDPVVPAGDPRKACGERLSGPPCRQVIVKDTAFRTWQALIFYLYTGKIKFLDFASKGANDLEARAIHSPGRLDNPDEPPACSPKSMYRLADKLGIAGLETLALQTIQTKLTSGCILQEYFSWYTSKYEKVLQMQLQYLCDYQQDPQARTVIANLWPEVVRKLLAGNAAHAEQALTVMLSQKLVHGWQQSRSCGTTGAGTSTTRPVRRKLF